MTLQDYNFLRKNMLEVVKLSNDNEILDNKISALEKDCKNSSHKINKLSEDLKLISNKSDFDDIELEISDKKVSMKSLKKRGRDLEYQNAEITFLDADRISLLFGVTWIIGMCLLSLIVFIFGVTYDFSNTDWYFVPESCETFEDCEEDNMQVTMIYGSVIVSLGTLIFTGIVFFVNLQKEFTHSDNIFEIKEIKKQIINESRMVKMLETNLDDYLAIQEDIVNKRNIITESQHEININQNRIQELLKEVENLAPYSNKL